MNARERFIGFIHASPAAVEPLNHYYAKEAPELRIVNLLDDGLLRFFASGWWDAAESRLAEMIDAASDIHRCELAMLTCSAVPRPNVEYLRRSARLPLLKIDEALARSAVQAGSRIGVIVTFEPTLKTSIALLEHAASEASRSIEIVPAVLSDAHKLLVAGAGPSHDELIAAAAERLAAAKVDVVVLAQVSMGSALSLVIGRVPIPVLSSLQTSLQAIRATLEES